MGVNSKVRKRRGSRSMPNGLCRIGDRVVMDGRNWSIERLGLRNENGYPLDIRIKAEDGSSRKVSAHGDLTIYPPAGEIPRDLKAFAKDQKLDVVRMPSNGEELVYELRCPQCGARPWLSMSSYESAAFRFAGGRFENGKPDLTDTDLELRCSCAGRGYELPADFEVNW